MCRCYAVVQYGWGTGIQTIRLKLKNKKSTRSRLVNKACDHKPEGSCLLETVESQNKTQEEDVKKDVGKLKIQEASSLTLEIEKGDAVNLDRRMLQERRMLMRSEVPEGKIVKELTFKKSFTRALTDKGGKLVNDLQNNSRAKVDIIPSHGEEETVVLRGSVVSVEKAEQLLEELQTSAQEILLSFEEKTALLNGGINCNLEKIYGRLQVPANLQGRKLVLFGKPEETKKARELVLKEMRGVLKKPLNVVLKEPLRGEVLGKQKVKELAFNRSFTRALTDRRGKLLKDIINEFGAKVDVIPSHGVEETLVLKGLEKSVDKAEEKLRELSSSALKIFLSYEEKQALVTGGRSCIMHRIRRKLQVPAGLQGSTLLLVGEPKKTKEAMEIILRELKLV